jgi:hypothetical protein
MLIMVVHSVCVVWCCVVARWMFRVPRYVVLVIMGLVQPGHDLAVVTVHNLSSATINLDLVPW